MDLKQRFTMESNIENMKKIFLLELGIDVMQKTRKRGHVEARAMMSKILYEVYKKGYTDIGRIFGVGHAVIYHYIKYFDMWCQCDKTLYDKYVRVLKASSLNIREISSEEANKIEYENIMLKLRVKELEDTLNSPIHKLVDSIPYDKMTLMTDRFLSIIRMNCQ